ncbi:MAG TPA: bifunctional 23S rRNA (guanine(2069)-N(7))-methyltransferase RlmK/23S rRNA (guanine(2445)-N(2))-methyltransferase RlmL [Candidatus Aphodovivens avistercoris]|nr:bifunctional 23S rRNA (guanine(2069)-N(7))-methyltransferase RlmK/23S rRNA (guanine(2445)-N(2))-methyltransferase RlmL [Candidatus Aphodovivens avistercoris]
MDTSHARDEREFFASCLAGLEPLLSRELQGLGIRRTRPLSGGVAFFCPMLSALRACLWSRLASRILLVAGRVEAASADALYEGVAALAWDGLLSEGATFAVRAHGGNEQLRNTSFIALKAKDAIADAVRASRGTRPNVDAASPDVSVDVLVHGAKATVSVDLAGASLYRRAYLDEAERDALSTSCAQAAALLALAGWEGLADGAALLDAQSADGVLACEAALLAAGGAPGLAREKWGFSGLACVDAAWWDELLAEADDRFEAGLAACAADGAGRIVAGLPSQRRRAAARKRFARAGVAPLVDARLGAWEGADALEWAQELARGGRVLSVASLLAAPDQYATEANAHACYGAFAQAAACATPGGIATAAGADASLEALLGSAPAAAVRSGRGRFAADLRAWDPGAAVRTVAVPDAQGGPDRAIAVRDAHADQFAARLRKNARERRKWARREGIACYRVYDADLPDFSVAIDVYEGDHGGEPGRFLHIAEYAPPPSIDADRARRRFEDVLALAPAVLGALPAHTFAKVRRREKGGGQYRSDERRPFIVNTTEDGLAFEVDLNGYLDTGLFLDHRLTRELVGSHARGARFLNLFAYTGSASVHAAAGGAAETVTVDLSQTYLDWAERNMAANGFDGPDAYFERSDAMEWVTYARRRGFRFDLIFVDPPTFSNSKAMGKRTWDVQRDHAELLIGVSRLLSEDGLAVFSCNLRSFKPDVETLQKYGVALEDITAQTIPHDFERNPKIHKCYLVRRA